MTKPNDYEDLVSALQQSLGEANNAVEMAADLVEKAQLRLRLQLNRRSALRGRLAGTHAKAASLAPCTDIRNEANPYEVAVTRAMGGQGWRNKAMRKAVRRALGEVQPPHGKPRKVREAPEDPPPTIGESCEVIYPAALRLRNDYGG